jgi:hypothetical protein
MTTAAYPPVGREKEKEAGTLPLRPSSKDETSLLLTVYYLELSHVFTYSDKGIWEM